MFRIIGIMLPLMLAGLIAPHLSGQQVPLNMTISVSPNGPLYSPNTFEVDVYLTPTNTGGVWPSGMVQPTGSVEFTGNGNFWSNSSLRAAGYAFCVYTGSIMPADLPLTIVASYPGDANYAPISKSISFTYLAGTAAPQIVFESSTLNLQAGISQELVFNMSPYEASQCSYTGTLPPGMMAWGGGCLLIEGTPTSAGVYPITISGQEINSSLAQATYVITVTEQLLVGSAGGTSSVLLPYSGAWTATANDPFLHVSAGSASGTGNAFVIFTCDALTGTGTRTGTLTIAGQTITVIQAGTNYMGPTAPGPPVTLTSSGLNSPYSVAVDGSDNVYFADTGNHALKQWSASTQQVTTIGIYAPNNPQGVATDGMGDVYIADTADLAITEYNPTIGFNTVVSSGLLNPTAVAADGLGNVYIADTGNKAIYEWSSSTQQMVPLVASGLNSPVGVAVDITGNVYIADSGNNAIYEWNVETQQVTPLISSGLNGPCGVAVDISGNVYIADTGNNAIKVWSASTQQVTSLVSGLNKPRGVAVDGSGNVYIADTGNNAIKEIPYAFVGPVSLTEPASAGTDWLLPVLPSTASLIGVFAPTSDSSWLTIDTVGTIASGLISFSFSAAPSTRVGHISLLGQQITVTQGGSGVQIGQTIIFTALANRLFSPSPFTVSAAVSSGLPIGFNSQTTSVCTVSGSQVTTVSIGTCTIQATQAGNSDYTAATPVNQSFQATRASQSITFGALVSRTAGAAPFMIGATASSGLPVSFASTTQAVCTVSGVTVTLLAPGTCVIQATQAGNNNYTAATPVDQTFPVMPGAGPRLGTNALLVGSAAGSSSVVLASNGAWTATANASFLHVSAGSASGTGNALVVFTYDAFSGTGTRAGTLTIAGFTVTVTQAGANYVVPAGLSPVITLVSSGLNSPGGVTVDGFGNVYIADNGDSTLKEWSASTQQVTSLASGVGSRGLGVDIFGNVYLSFGPTDEWIVSTQQLITLVSSGLPYAWGVGADVFGNVYVADNFGYEIEEWNASTQQLTGILRTAPMEPSGLAVDGSGNVYVSNYGYNGPPIQEWNSSTQQLTTLVASGIGPTAGLAVDGSGNLYITEIFNNAIKEWNASTGQVTTLVSSGLNEPMGVAVDSVGNVYVADRNNNAIKEIPYAFVGPASLNEPASAGTDSLLPVLPSTAPLTGVFAPASDSSWLTIGTIANGVISFSFAANTSGTRVAHITVLGQQIIVTQNGAQNGSAAQTIAFATLANRSFDTAAFALSATASSGLPVSFASETTSVCTVSGAQVAPVALGTCTIQATQSGNATYAAATPVNQSFQVTLGNQTISFAALADRALGSAPFTVSATASSGLPVSFSLPTPITASCTISGAAVTPLYVGVCTIQATQAGNALYAAATPVSQSFQVTPEAISLDQTNVWFGATNNGAIVTAPQTVSVTAPAGVNWSVSSSLSYVVVSPTSGVGSGTFTISIQNTALPSPASINATVTVTAAGVSNSPQWVNVSLNVMNAGTAAVPFGSFDTPANNATGLSASIAVTGWALDVIGMQKVQIWRDPVTGETPTSNGLIYIGDATFVPGARPDVLSLYPSYPLSNRAGWGYLMLTNGLPNSGGAAGTGNGTYTLHAIATSIDGNTTDLGSKTITCDNADASTPFGAIDTPGQGATVSGTIVNFGWALTPQPYSIPIDGSTIWVTVDNQYLGHPVYNQYRSDIATGFPGYANASGAVGYYYLDTTTLSNGIHTMGWLVTDNDGRASGIGSRFIWVLN